MSPKWTDVLQALSSAAALVVAVVGFLVLRHQIKLVERGIRGETHSGLYQHNFQVMKFIGDNPQVRSYFYDGVELKKEDPEYTLTMTTAGIMAALFEHVAMQRGNLPNEVWKGWLKHIEETYAKSQALQHYYQEHKTWYSIEVLKLLKDPTLLTDSNETSASKSSEATLER